MTTPPSPWSRTARGMRQRVDAAMDRMADLIKNALLDGPEFFDEDEVSAAPLIEMDPDEFAARMRPRVEQALRQVAEVLNEAPDQPPALIAEATCDLFTDLGIEALKVAAEMRLDAALSEVRPAAEGRHGMGPPDGEWARRYRLMHADDEA
jgi:hypothetical protein